MKAVVTIERGTVRDYDALAGHHYRAGRPATRALVLRAVDAMTADLAGVLVVSYPTLNGAWRREAWGERYAGGKRGRRAATARLNREVRIISRVIVEPRYRGLGVAKALVRAYLARPLTRRTETVAAMGRYCPLFETAGMRRVACRPTGATRRLANALKRAGVTPRSGVRGLGRSREACRAVRAWARSSRGTRSKAGGSVGSLLALAAGAWLAPPVVYVDERRRWVKRSRGQRGEPWGIAGSVGRRSRSERNWTRASCPGLRRNCTSGS